MFTDYLYTLFNVKRVWWLCKRFDYSETELNFESFKIRMPLPFERATFDCPSSRKRVDGTPDKQSFGRLRADLGLDFLGARGTAGGER